MDDSGRCECCGRLSSELTPFCNGALLGKTYRVMGPDNEEREAMYACLEEFPHGVVTEEELCEAIAGRNEKYGKEKVWRMIEAVQTPRTVGVSWECSDCIRLDGDEYRKRRRKGYEAYLWRKTEEGIEIPTSP